MYLDLQKKYEMEAFIKDQKQIIHYLHKQAGDHVKTRNVLIQINEELEKEINVKDEEIMRLTKELRETTFKESNDVYKLLEEIEFIKNVNYEKEDTLADVMKENQSLHEDLQHLGTPSLRKTQPNLDFSK